MRSAVSTVRPPIDGPLRAVETRRASRRSAPALNHPLKLRYLLLLPVLWTAGCAAPGPVFEPDDLQAAARHQQADLAGILDWSASGRISLRSEDEAWHATLDWLQRGERYRIRLVGPLSQGTLEVAGGPDGVTYRDSTGRELSAGQPEDLVRAALGWDVPVSLLGDWMLGREAQAPVAGQDQAAREVDAAGRLAHLRRQGWEAWFSDYREVDGHALPHRLDLARDGLTVRLAVRRWTVGQP